MKLKDVMTGNVEVINPDATIVDAAAKMKQLNVGMLPVCDGDRLCGAITDRDLTVRATSQGTDPKSMRVRDVMTPHVVYCFEDQDVQEAAKVMQEKQIRRLLVLDRNKKLTGIVSLGDLAVDTHDEQLSARTLENISRPAQPNR